MHTILELYIVGTEIAHVFLEMPRVKVLSFILVCQVWWLRSNHNSPKKQVSQSASPLAWAELTAIIRNYTFRLLKFV